MAVSTLVVESGMVLTACMGYAEWGNELSEGEDGDEEGGKEGREEDEEEEEWKESGKERGRGSGGRTGSISCSTSHDLESRSNCESGSDSDDSDDELFLYLSHQDDTRTIIVIDDD